MGYSSRLSIKIPLFIFVSAFFGIVFFLADYFSVEDYLHKDKWYILLFFFITQYLSFQIHKYAFEDLNKNFIALHLSSLVIKFILSLIFVGIMIWNMTSDPMLFVANFFVLYLFFTVFEIYNLNTNLRRFSERSENPSNNQSKK